MGRKKSLSEIEKGMIIAYMDSGLNVKDVSKKIGRSVHCINNYIAIKETDTIKPKRGRKRCFSDTTVGEIKELSKLSYSANTIKKTLNLSVSSKTVTKYLKESGFVYRKPYFVPPLTESHMLKRLDWAKLVISKYDWNAVLFTDEKKFNLDGPDGNKKMWTDKKVNFRTKRKFGGGSIMVWGGISRTIKTPLIKIDGNLNSEKYQEMLKFNIFPLLESQTIFQQDNAPCHVSKSTLNFFSINGIQTMNWPALSPDLNIIENAWSQLSAKVYPNGKQYKNVNELWVEVQMQWNEITTEYITKLVDSMPNRIFSVIRNNGNTIKY